MNRIDLWLKALGQAFEKTGEIAPWPLHIGAVAPYFSDKEASDIFTKLKMISKEGNAQEIVEKLLISPSVAKALLMDFIVGMKVAKPKINKEERVWFVNYTFDVLEKMQTGDIFCLDGENLILSGSQVEELYKETPWISVNPANIELCKSLYKVSASSKSLIWSLYFYGWDDIGYEIHGPYRFKDKSGKDLQLVVTDYFDLKPDLLWESIRDFPYKSIKFYALYKDDIDLSVDIFGHFVNSGNLLNSAVGLYVEVDKAPLKTTQSADTLISLILKTVSNQHNLIKGMKREKITQKYIESRYYAYRKWREHFKEDWYPPEEVLKRIKEWGEIKISSGGGPSTIDLKKAFDPRTDYVPGT